MRKILTSRLFRFLVCLVLICSLLINVSPIKARADVVTGGLVAAGATGAVVSVPVAIAIGATLIALGIIADAASQNPYALQKLASDVGDALSAAGTYVVDGMVEMYRFMTDTGEAVYYAAADFMEAVRSSCVSNTLTSLAGSKVVVGGSTYTISQGYFDRLADYSKMGHCLTFFTGSGLYVMGSTKPFVLTSDNGWYTVTCSGNAKFSYTRFMNNGGSVGGGTTDALGGLYIYFEYPVSSLYATPSGLVLENFLTVPIDGTSARTWSEAYANRGLYIASGGSQNPDDGGEGNDGWKFLLPLAFLTGADLWAMSQADQWTGSTPPEFGDYSTEEELTVTPAPEFDGYQAIEIAPVTNPNPDPGTGKDPGTGTDPGTGANPGTGTDPGTDSGSSSWTPPSDMGKFTLDLKQYFPFCIPFDLYAFFTCLNAEPVAPVIEWIIPLPGGKTYPFEIDLSAFDSVAQILRRMQLLLFCVGLAFKTRDLIKG